MTGISHARLKKTANCGLLDITRALGLLINVPKSDMDPAQLVQFVGIVFDLVMGMATPAKHRIDKFLELTKSFLQNQPQTAESWKRALGHMNSLEQLVPRGRLYMRPLQYHLRRHWTQKQDDLKCLIPWTERCRPSLLWWMDEDNLT